MKKYTKAEILKAAEIGEISMIDANHLVSLLEEASGIVRFESIPNRTLKQAQENSNWKNIDLDKFEKYIR